MTIPSISKIAIFGLGLLFVMPRASAHQSDDPTVVKMIRSGVTALDSGINAKTYYTANVVHSGGTGELMLTGYAHMKSQHDPKSATVRKAVSIAQEFVAQLNSKEINTGAPTENKSVYSAAVATMLLAEVDKKKYRSQLKALEGYFRGKRTADGFYTYPEQRNGDVSQTQYAVLALWTLDRAGIEVDYGGVLKTINWLLAVQDSSGGWPYLGEIPKSGGRAKQSGVNAGISMAGGSALMIASDILGAWGKATAEDDPNIAGLPKQIRLFMGEEVEENRNVARPKVDAQTILDSIALCDQYLSSNSPDPGAPGTTWPYYQLYTLERYESFKELIYSDAATGEVEWYNMGIEFLIAKAGGVGWPAAQYTTDAVSSSFAVLFMIRSTKKSIGTISAGAMTGGWQLPEDTSDIIIDGTQIKDKADAAASVASLLGILEDSDPDALEGKSIPDDLKLADDPKERKDQLDRLERLARGSQSWQARRVAMRLLGQSDEMRMVPTLIYGLSDPDPVVKIYARDGLRFISRKFDGFGTPNKPSERDTLNATREWKKWYLTVDPTYLFID
jgi:hypothetical protein